MNTSLYSCILAMALTLAMTAFVPPADARHAASKHPAVGRVHYGGIPGIGYWRRGPKQGYGFGFSSYRGDPFGADDYYDRNRCYYLRRHDFCVANKIFTGFR